MIESQNPEIDLLRLKDRVLRSVAADRDVSISLDDSDLIAAYPRPARAPVPSYEPAQVQPGFTPNPENRYQIHELMAYRDAAFISVAFTAVLGRPPDPEGYEHYLGMLRAGHSKAEILGRMHSSEEGRARGAHIEGLGPRFLLARVSQLPVMGKLAQVASSVAHLPAGERNHRNFEDYVVSLVGQVQENARAQGERLRGAVEALVADQDAIFSQLERRLSRHRSRLELMRGALNAERAKVSALERTVSQHTKVLEELQRELAKSKATSPEAHALDGFYADFESRFRGPREEIKKRQGVYLPFITQAGAGTAEAPILDLGCGRGEWLELLSEQKLVARGADLNRVFLEDNRQRGLDVVEMDALACLRGLKDQSFGAITAFHVIEHLPFRALIAVIDEAKRVLKPGGLLIFETPNPSNLQVGATNFYLDPTHLNPLPSGLSAALLELRGFHDVSVKELHPYPQSELVKDGVPATDATINRFLFGPQDYGVIGWKVAG